MARRFLYVSLGILAPSVALSPATAEVEAGNLALGASASASVACRPESLAFNGVYGPDDEGWVVCGGPPQWIVGDWMLPAVVDSIRLQVNVTPNGPHIFRHEVRFRDSQGAWQSPVVVIERYFTKFEFLSFAFSNPITDATAIRVETYDASPQFQGWFGWFEIEAFGSAAPTATSATSWGQVKAIFR